MRPGLPAKKGIMDPPYYDPIAKKHTPMGLAILQKCRDPDWELGDVQPIIKTSKTVRVTTNIPAKVPCEAIKNQARKRAITQRSNKPELPLPSNIQMVDSPEKDEEFGGSNFITSSDSSDDDDGDDGDILEEVVVNGKMESTIKEKEFNVVTVDEVMEDKNSFGESAINDKGSEHVVIINKVMKNLLNSPEESSIQQDECTVKDPMAKAQEEDDLMEIDDPFEEEIQNNNQPKSISKEMVKEEALDDSSRKRSAKTKARDFIANITQTRSAKRQKKNEDPALENVTPNVSKGGKKSLIKNQKSQVKSPVQSRHRSTLTNTPKVRKRQPIQTRRRYTPKPVSITPIKQVPPNTPVQKGRRRTLTRKMTNLMTPPTTQMQTRSQSAKSLGIYSQDGTPITLRRGGLRSRAKSAEGTLASQTAPAQAVSTNDSNLSSISVKSVTNRPSKSPSDRVTNSATTSSMATRSRGVLTKEKKI